MRLIKKLTRLGYLVEEEGMSYLADLDPDNPLTPLQAASCTYRIALVPRAGQRVLSLRTVLGRDKTATAGLCADAHGFSLHAGVRCGTHQRKALERLCRHITRPAIANERLKEDAAGNVVLQLKSPWRDGTAQHAPASARMGWAHLLKRVFDLDLEHCPQCGGEFKIIAAIEEPAVIVRILRILRILTHLGVPARAPPRSPARLALARSDQSTVEIRARGATQRPINPRENKHRANRPLLGPAI